MNGTSAKCAESLIYIYIAFVCKKMTWKHSIIMCLVNVLKREPNVYKFNVYDVTAANSIILIQLNEKAMILCRRGVVLCYSFSNSLMFTVHNSLTYWINFISSFNIFIWNVMKSINIARMNSSSMRFRCVCARAKEANIESVAGV